MSPRGFKLGLALFVAMSGLFAAKLLLTGAGGLRTPWRSLATTSSQGPDRIATASPAPTPVRDARPAVVSTPSPSPPDEAAVAKAAETAAHTAPPLAESDKALVSAIRLELKTRGYALGAGTSDLDMQSRAAIIAFEADNDMRLTGEPSQALLHHLLLGATGVEANSSSPPAPRAEEVIRSVQASLKRAGHPDQKVDGQMSRETVETIRAFERTHNMKVTGRVSGELVAQLQHVARDAMAGAGQ